MKETISNVCKIGCNFENVFLATAIDSKEHSRELVRAVANAD